MANPDALAEYLKDFRLWLQDAGFSCNSEVTQEIWNGNISVDWIDAQTGKTHSATHRVTILLPVGFPHKAPVVFSTDESPLKSSWHLAPEPAQSLCLWTPNVGWQPHFTAQRLLRRIEDWFLCYHTDNWPADSEVPDLHRYLEILGLVLIGDEWLPDAEKTSGEFTLWRHRSADTFPAIACYGKKPELRLTQALLFSENSYRIYDGIWYRLTNPLVPPDNLGDLLVLIDRNLDEVEGYAGQICLHKFGQKPREGHFPLALAYTDMQGQERWLFLWVQFPQSDKKRPQVHWTKPVYLSNFKVKSFQTAPARSVDLLRRSAYLSKHLHKHKVILFGVGALGGSVALLLAKAGVGEIRIVDDDKLTPGNAMRHICGLNWIGFKKTTAVKHQINIHNPDCSVVEYTSSWNPDELHTYIRVVAQ